MKRVLSILLTAVMLLGVLIVVPVSANAASTIKHAAFEILNPVKNSVYDVNTTIEFQINRKKWIAETVDGWLQDDYNYIFIDVCKGNVVKEEFVVHIYYKWDVPGTTALKYFTPTETGTYTVRVGFATPSVYDKIVEENLKEMISDLTYVGSFDFKVVKKKANPVTVKTAVKSIKASAMKKTEKSVKSITVKKAKGTVTFKKVKSGTDSKIYEKIKVDKKTGKITFKKGTYKKGTYKVNLAVTAAGNNGYKPKTVTKTVKIKIK